MPRLYPPSVPCVSLNPLASLIHDPVPYDIFLALGGDTAIDAGVRYACSSGASLSVHFISRGTRANYAHVCFYNRSYSVNFYQESGHSFKAVESHNNISRSALVALAAAYML